MKKFILLLTIAFTLLSCNIGYKDNTANDVRKIRVGMSTNEVKYLLDEPRRIEVQNGYEEWYFRYEGKLSVNTFVITVIDNKVSDFQTY